MSMPSVQSMTQRPQASPAATPVRIEAVTTDADRQQWRGGFIGAYQTIFAGAPYHERFTPAEAEGVWQRLTRIEGHLAFVAATPGNKLVGFGLAIPLAAQRDVARELSGLISVHHTFYLAELGVLPEYRGRGIASQLVRARLSALDTQRFHAVVLRAPSSRSGDYPLYTTLGFEDMGAGMTVSALRTDGRVTTDRRVFLHSVVSQIRLDSGTSAS